MLLGAGLSGFVLFTPIWPAVRHQASKSAVFIMAIIVTLHLLLAVGFMLYFFHVPAGAGDSNRNSTVVVPPSGAENDTKAENDAQAAQVKASEESAPEEKKRVNMEEETDKDNPKTNDSESKPKENNKADVPTGQETKTDQKVEEEKKSEEITNKETRSEAQPGSSTERR